MQLLVIGRHVLLFGQEVYPRKMRDIVREQQLRPAPLCEPEQVRSILVPQARLLSSVPSPVLIACFVVYWRASLASSREPKSWLN